MNSISTSDWELIEKLIPILAPVMIIQLILIVTALIACARAEHTTGPKWMWVLLIIFIQILGPVMFFIVGRRKE
ncbi:MAG: PLD nuclease N-terminal domain-containing protein [Candidatus Pristimantibacillus sp.]